MTFEHFLDVITATHLGRIRDPVEAVFPPLSWMYKRIPAWRWAHAHFLLNAGSLYEFCYSDDATDLAFELLRHRARKTIPIPGVKPLIDAILVYERNDRRRWLLEAHLLLPELPGNLSQKLGLAPETIDFYTSVFFDVRQRLNKSCWVQAHALGPPACNGYADDEWEPVWKRIAYRGTERALDLAVAVTTGAGLEPYSDEERDTVILAIENMRFGWIHQLERMIQLSRRYQAEERGEHPSVYHVARHRRRQPARAPEPTEGVRDSELRSYLKAIGETSFV